MADNVKYHCSKCGAPAAANDWFCTKCGGSIIQGAAEMINPNNGANSAYNEQNNANNYSANNAQNNNANDYSAYNNTQNNNANDYSAYNNTQNNNANDYSAYNNTQNNNANGYSAYNNEQNNNNAGYTAAGAYSAYNNQNDNNAANNNPYGQNSYEPNNASNGPENNYAPNNGDFYSQNANTQNSEPEKKKGGLGKIIKLAAIAVAVIAIIGIAAALLFTFVFNTSNFVEAKTDISCVYDEANDKTLILVNGKVLKATIDGEAYVADYSLDGKTAIIKKAIKDEENGKTTYEYYTFRNKKLKKIDADIRGLTLSQNGDVVVYVPEVDLEDVTDISDISYELVWYKVSNGETKTITNKYLSSYKLSPDGKSVLFEEGDSDDYSMKLWSNGKTTEIKDNAKPVLLSNGAKYIYYTEYDEDDGESTLYVMKNKKEPVKLGTDMYVDDSNVDNTEVLLKSSNAQGETTYYISKNGKDKVKIDADTFNYLTPNDAVGIKHFKNLYFINRKTTSKGTETTLCYLNSKLDVVEVKDDIVDAEINDSGKVVYCEDEDGKLYRGTGTKEDGFKEVAKDVVRWYITSDGSACYYITEDDDEDTTLCYVKKNGKAKEIAKDVSYVYMTHDNYALFLEDIDIKDGEGTLYSSRNGSEKKKIADDVSNVGTAINYSVYGIESEGKMIYYIATRGTNFEKAINLEIEGQSSN